MRCKEYVIVKKWQDKTVRISASVIKIIDIEYKISIFNMFKEENVAKN